MRSWYPGGCDLFSKKYGLLHIGKVSNNQDVYYAFLLYQWPGNIRKIENVIVRLMIISDVKLITKEDFTREFLTKPHSHAPVKPLRNSIFELKKEMVHLALTEARGKKASFSKLLGLPPSNFFRLLKNLGMMWCYQNEKHTGFPIRAYAIIVFHIMTGYFIFPVRRASFLLRWRTLKLSFW